MTTAAIDDYTAWALVAMPHADDHDVIRWFEVLRTAYDSCQADGETSWDALGARIAAVGAEQAFDAATVEQYLEALAGTGQATELVERMLELSDQMPALYWQLRSGPADDGAEQATGDPLGWVTQEQRDYLESAWGTAWPDSLTEYLNGNWGAGWEQHPDDHKAAWLQDLIHTWSAQGPAETPAEGQAVPAEAAEGQAAPAEAADVEIPPEVAEELVDSALKEVLAEIPGAEELSEEEIAELRAEILEELGTNPAARQ